MRKLPLISFIFPLLAISLTQPGYALSDSGNTRSVVILEPATSTYTLPESKRDLPLVKLASSPMSGKVNNEFTTTFAQFILELDDNARKIGGTDTPCTEIFDDKTILFLSNEDGGFARRGFWFLADPQTQPTYCDLLYVDMTVSESELNNGGFIEIFAHETAHVILQRLVGKIENAPSSRFHNVFAITDYQTAFDEGFGIYFQTLTALLANHSGQQQRLQGRFSPSLADQWFSRIDGRQRIFDVMHNRLVFARYVDQQSTTERVYAQEGMSSAFRSELLNAQAMHSSEGVLATLFYRLATDPSLAALTPSDSDWYAKAVAHHTHLFKLISSLDLRSDNLPPWLQLLEQLKLQGSALAVPAAISYLHTTYARSADRELSAKLQQLIMAGHSGDLKGFMAHYGESNQAILSIAQQWHNENRSLATELGRPLWLLAEAIKIPSAPWSAQQLPLTINLNMATANELAMLPQLSANDIAALLSERTANGPYNSMLELSQRLNLDEIKYQSLKSLAQAHQQALTKPSSGNYK